MRPLVGEAEELFGRYGMKLPSPGTMKRSISGWSAGAERWRQQKWAISSSS